MSWQMNFWGFPRLHTYKDALQHYESIKPIRGSNNLRPIADRRKQHCSIHQLFNGDIACQLYSTDCVVYHQDDSITVDFGGWHTNSTSAFIHSISPFSAHSNGHIHTSKGIFKVPSHGLKILPDGTPVNPVQEYRTLLDKKKAAETRKKLKPFLNWVAACKKLGGEFDGVTYNYNQLSKLIAGDEEVDYTTFAGYYFPAYANRKKELLQDAYQVSNAFLQIPVPIGTERRPTQWD